MKEKEKEEAERTEKAAQRARTQQARNAEKIIQQSQDGNREALQSPTEGRKHRKRTVGIKRVAGAVEAAVLATPAIMTRRSRNVTIYN